MTPRWTLLVFAFVATACSGAAAPASGPEPAPTTAVESSPAESSSAESSVRPLKLDAESRTVGSAVRATATDLPPGAVVALEWDTVTGGWVIEDYYRFLGKKYSPSTVALGQFTVDGSGQLNAQFSIPEDYGGVHDVKALVDGKVVAQGGIEVTQSFEMHPASGPVGTPIELRVKGLGWRTLESTWVVNWDNRMVGFVSAASSKGSAVARFRAAGPRGSHIVKVLTGYQGQGYLNHEQAPSAHLPRPQFVFETTPGVAAGPAAFAEPYVPQTLPATKAFAGDVRLAIEPQQGPVGSKARLRGEGFTPGASLDLLWQTYVGNRVSDSGFEPSEQPLGTVAVGDDGRVDTAITVPDDLGGLHGVALRNSAGTLAQTYFAIETSVVSMTPTSGPVGTPVTIHLKGVGWTEYDNIYIATYDNAYMGYACGFNSQGDVVINFVATGTVGPHIIDLYPGIYQGPPTETQLLYRQPQLTYKEDHPGNKIPALRFMFHVTEPGGTR
ncbi:MAG: hypothetical protein AB7I50_11695 [Vicinamibacterales bacterium]